MAAAVRAPRALRPRLRVPEGRDPGLFWKGINRLKAVHSIANWRADAGEVPAKASVVRYVEVIADALRHADVGGHRYMFDVPAIREHWLPREWRDCISDDEIHTVVQDVERTRTPDEIMTAREAGRLLGLHLAEIEAMEASGTHVSLPPVDVSPDEHEARCLERKRAGARERSRRYRATKIIANPRHALPSKGQRDRVCNIAALTQEAAVRAAIVGGAAIVADIVLMTGIPATTVRPILSRMVRAGTIMRTGRGNYSPAEPSPLAQQDGEARDAAAVTIHTGPEIQTEPREPPSQIAHDAPALALAADTGRALEARGTVGARRPHTPAGPDAHHLAPAAPLHPRRPAFSCLPGALSLHTNRSTVDAAPSARRA